MPAFIDITSGISFRTARSGGKGGQHVNKVETMVEGYFDIENSTLLDEAQKKRLQEKLGNRITREGYLLVKSQTERSQFGNKQQVIRKMNELVNKALIVPRKRVRTRPSPASVAKRLQYKKQQSEKKQQRRLPPPQY